MANPEDTFTYDKGAELSTSNEEPMEQFPRQMLFEFTDSHGPSGPPVAAVYLREATPNVFPSGMVPYHSKPQGFSIGKQLGWPQADQSYEDDGFRFYHTFSIASMTVTGWSSVMRNVLSLRRRSLPDVERVEDSPRAMHAEEYIFTWFGRTVLRNGGLSLAARSEVCAAVDTVSAEMRPFLPEDHGITPVDWEKSLTTGYVLWSLMKDSIGADSPAGKRETVRSAFVHADLDTKTVRFSAESGELAKAADPL